MNDQTSEAAQNRFDQQGQTVIGPQTNVVGNVQGSVLSGQFQGPVTITEVSIEQAQHEQLADAIIAPAAVFDRIHIERFVGRGWLTDQVNDFLREEKCGYFVLEAEAGLGKTTFMAKLAQTKDTIHLFCEDAAGPENIGKGLKSLAAQLVLAYQLAPWASAGVLPPAAERPDVFYKLLAQAAGAARSRQPAARVILVIDALDQAGMPERQNVLGLPRTLPEGVFIIASQRPTSVELEVDAPLRMVQLTAEQADNLKDMRGFLAAWPGISQALRRSDYSQQPLIDVLMDKCCGVWIYLHYVLDEIERGRRTLSQLHDLPDGIVKYYIEYWRQEREDDEAQWYGLSLPLLAALTAAPEPVAARQLCAWAGVQGQIGQAQRRLSEDWGSFISAIGDGPRARYRFYHATLRDFFAGQVDRRGLPKAARGFIDELHQATITALYQTFRAAPAPEEKRRHALQLVRWQGLNEIEDSSTDEFLGILELVAGFAYAEAERRYLIECIDSILTSSAGGMSRRQQARLLIHRAGLYGNLGEIDEAADSYQQAEELAGELIESGDAQPEDLKLNARIKHGRGVIILARAESLEDPSDEASRQALLEQAERLLTEAADLAARYGVDPILKATVWKELCWVYTLIPDWARAEAAYKEALDALRGATDRAASDSYRARVLEIGVNMYGGKAETLGHSPAEALVEYRKALDLAGEEIGLLEAAGPSVLLTKAYINWGECAMAVDQLTGDQPPQYLDRACERWRAAANMAHMLGIFNREKYVRRLIEQSCPGPASEAPVGVPRT